MFLCCPAEPLLATLSIIHALLIGGFLVSCLLGSDTGVTFLYDSSTGWKVFFVITAFLVCATNILVLLIGAVCIKMLVGVIAIFLGLIAAILFIIWFPCILIAAIVSGENCCICHHN